MLIDVKHQMTFIKRCFLIIDIRLMFQCYLAFLFLRGKMDGLDLQKKNGFPFGQNGKFGPFWSSKRLLLILTIVFSLEKLIEIL
jgi:hypothetical protein